MTLATRTPVLAVAAFATMLLPITPVELSSQQPQQQSEQIAPAARDSVIEGILAALDRGYVFPEKAVAMRAAITERRASGAYDALTGGADLATVLTTDLQGISRDKHLRVRYVGAGARAPFRVPPPAGSPADPGSCTPTNEVVRADSPSGFGICGAGILPGNIGYVELRSFAHPPEASSETVARAMSLVAGADALIIDVRRNGGGSPHAVRLVSSYLFGEDTVHLNSLYSRPDNRTDHFWTHRTVAGRRYGPDKPVYVLTSRRTFSAAEEFTYNLQARKRAIVVGDTTGGGAHPGRGQAVGPFMVFVPSGRAINPITKTNWEGTGVVPDVAVTADSALSAALVLARKRR